MIKIKTFLIGITLAFVLLTTGSGGNKVMAANTIAGETFNDTSTAANAWISGGSPAAACLTAATVSATGSIPACSSGPIDAPGSGVLRLTPNLTTQSGFAIYNTPVSAGNGLDIEFDMFQYGGTGADGIVFFLIDGSASPTVPGAAGGSLGYSSNPGASMPGIVGGYVGIGFDRYGNFSNPAFGTNGPGRIANSITVRGSEASGYNFVSTNPANAALGVEAAGSRASAKRHVRVTVSTNNIMNVAVNYFGSNGLETEISNIDLNTINGAGSLPPSFKFGFSAGTGGQRNYHEISGLAVSTLSPSLSAASPGSTGKTGEQSVYPITITNDAGAEPTTGLITVTDTLPAELRPVEVSGTGWSCSIANTYEITCTRPGNGTNALAPGASAPPINIKVRVSESALPSATYQHTIDVSTPNDTNLSQTTANFVMTGSGDLDGILKLVEDAAPNSGDVDEDGTPDGDQPAVTSFMNPLTGTYAVLKADSCSQNSQVSAVAEAANTKADGNYSYPAGLMNFRLDCGTPGRTATVTQYYFGEFDISKIVMRKYNPVSQTYTTIPAAVLSNVMIGGRPVLKVMYQITDGSSYDDDGLANGIIVDPAGPAIADAVAKPAGTLADTGMNLTAVTTLAGLLLMSAVIVRFVPVKIDK